VGVRTAPRIELHIEELVLHGFAAAHGDRIRVALESELARVLADRGLPSALTGGARYETIDAGTIAAGPGSPAEEVASHAAIALHEGMSR
jgi:hypothetical protein